MFIPPLIWGGDCNHGLDKKSSDLAAKFVIEIQSGVYCLPENSIHLG